MNNYRPTYRQKILELFDEGLVGKDELFINVVNWLSEQDAREFVEHYNYDGHAADPQELAPPPFMQEWHDFDPDC
jgi:hypothetical protein